MKIGVRTLVPIAVISVVVAFGIGGKHVLEQFDIDAWTGRALDGQLEADERQTAELDEQKRRLDKRVALKELVAHDVIGGRLTLAEASARLLALNELHPENMTGARCMHANDSDEVICARQVIHWIEVHANSSADLERLGQLQAELRAIIEGPQH